MTNGKVSPPNFYFTFLRKKYYKLVINYLESNFILAKKIVEYKLSKQTDKYIVDEI